MFTSLDPVEAKQWVCIKAGDLQCEAVLASSDPVGPDFCQLGPGRTQWTQPGDSIISDFGLTCGDAWKVGLINSCYFIGMAVGGESMMAVGGESMMAAVGGESMMAVGGESVDCGSI